MELFIFCLIMSAICSGVNYVTVKEMTQWMR